MKVVLRHPTREVEVDGLSTVSSVLKRLDILPDTVLVIRNGELLMSSEHLEPDDVIELRPVISGG
ncbi:MAG: MoaD/ThiS family protein [Acidimicrobiia bacterium]|nr:MoaD/ThiS family protein [Acidimicrobiia bacterium]MBT8251094.1 MoaD/ThiS family protein [Acidimicrobiia bacterium]NNC41610.1 MoaD/ThiS family protein [Acidimicrobiia bacterium]NND13824.1 MoaD/ThiS family protein [Acidimicrobiia bacterium]NNL29258.1 MoaD/ThiS family protein [Acidimicrobiia bacterium]